MRILVLGCGMQGKAVLHDLSRSHQVKEVVCADSSPENLGSFKDYLDMKKIKIVKVDASEKGTLIPLGMPSLLRTSLG